MKKTLLRLALLVAATLGAPEPVPASRPLDYFLPEDTTYDASVPTPESVLGYQVGEWHVRHDQIVEYMHRLSDASPRVELIETGRTYENRPLLLARITSPDNAGSIETIRQQHLALTRTGSDHPPLEEMPVVVYLGYSVHGNESSGSNASLLIAYYLAAAQNPEVMDLLENAVILLDPSLNPDGLSRFSHWANIHRGKNLVADANHREHQEAWPGGRTNHYWFDLNRDWLLLQHPESKARVHSFHRWKPNVLTDFHEMGSNATYFFQPGVPSRKNPLTPDENVRLTERIAAYHAQALDAKGVLYYSEENFDDFYYGKGSTYPDVNGCIGILFEQASSRGHLRESIHGEFDFAFTIRNQCLTSLSTLRAAHDLRVDLLRYQKQFYADAIQAANKSNSKAIVFGSGQHIATTHTLLDIFRSHDIVVHELAKPIQPGNQSFAPGEAFLVPANQPQFLLSQALTETRTTFPDSIFYDVSTWTLPLAMNVPHARLDALPKDVLGARVGDTSAPKPAASAPAAYAYAFAWHEYYAPRALARLLKEEVRARVATRPFEAMTTGGQRRQYSYGTIVVPMGIQDTDADQIHEIITSIAGQDFVAVEALETGLTPVGIDLGSPSLRALEMPRPMILAGSGVSSYEVGELWHLLDQRMDMQVSLIDRDDFDRIDLDEYTHLIMVNGNYSSLGEDGAKRIETWVQRGGVLIATKGAVRWAGRSKIANVVFSDDPEEEEKKKKQEEKEKKTEEKPKRYDYVEHDHREDAQIISGAIFETDVDITHPIGYGYSSRKLPVFRNHRWFMKPSEDPYATVARYTAQPLLSGYISSKNMEELPETASVIAQRNGRGSIVLILDNPNFRAFWYGTNKLFLNALFFGSIIDRTP